MSQLRVSFKAGQLHETVDYVYDDVGNVTQKTLLYKGGNKAFSYSYDSINRMVAATDENGDTSYTYTSSGKITSKSYPNGISAQYGYDASGGMTALDISENGSPIKSYQVMRDMTMNITSITEDETSTSTYSYDAGSRLTAENNPWLGEKVYTYDEAGNVLSVATTGGSTMTYSYNDADQLISDSNGAVYTYNQHGDLISAESSGNLEQYSWDGKGRLIKVEADSETVDEYAYDPFDRVITSGKAGEINNYVYDTSENRELAVLNGSRDLVKLMHAGADGMICISDGETPAYYSYNPHSDVSLITDETGTINSQLHYDAWGKVAEETAEPYTYLGLNQKRTYASTGLIQMGVRYYNPETGRFISRDPLSGEDEVTISRNRYIYSYDNPGNVSDMSGLSPEFDINSGITSGMSVNTQGNISELKGGASAPNQRQQSTVCASGGSGESNEPEYPPSPYDQVGYLHYTVDANGDFLDDSVIPEISEYWQDIRSEVAAIEDNTLIVGELVTAFNRAIFVNQSRSFWIDETELIIWHYFERNAVNLGDYVDLGDMQSIYIYGDGKYSYDVIGPTVSARWMWLNIHNEMIIRNLEVVREAGELVGGRILNSFLKDLIEW